MQAIVAVAVVIGILSSLGYLPFSILPSQRHTQTFDDPRGEGRAPTVLVKLTETRSDLFFDIRLENTTFRIQANRLYTVLEESPILNGEVDSGFLMTGIWPGFGPKTQENLPLFRGISVERGNIVDVDVARACMPSEDDTSNRRKPCDTKQSMENSWHAFSGIARTKSFISATAPNGPETRPMPGMKLIGFNDADGHGMRGVIDAYEARKPRTSRPQVFDEDVYQALDKKGRIMFTTCLRRLGGPGCDHRFIWRDRFEVNIRFNIENIPHWQNLKNKVVDVLEDSVVKGEEPRLPTGAEHIVYPPIRKQ